MGGRPRWAGCLGLSDTVDSSSGLGQIVQLAGLMHLPRALRPQRQRLPRQTREHARRIVATVHGQQRSQHVGAIEQRRRAIHAHYQAGRVMGAGARRHVDAPARLPFVVAGWHGSAVGVGRLQCGLQRCRRSRPHLIPHAVALAASVAILPVEHEAGGCAAITASVDEAGFTGIKRCADLIGRDGIAVDEVVGALCVAHDDLHREPLSRAALVGLVGVLDDGAALGLGGFNLDLELGQRLCGDAVAASEIHLRVVFNRFEILLLAARAGNRVNRLDHFASPESASHRLASGGSDALSMGINVRAIK